MAGETRRHRGSKTGGMREGEIDKERGDDATGREGKKTRVKPNQIKELMATEENE